MSLHPPQSRCWASIDLAALERNVNRIRASLPPSIRYLAVVKADAYGHGLPQVAARMMHAGADGFAVATLAEAAALRELGSGWPILTLSPSLPEEAPRYLDHGVTPTLSSLNEVQVFARTARERGVSLPVHAKIDTGMGRAGIWFTQAGELIDAIREEPSLELGGVFTHFASADCDPAYTRMQRERFIETLRANDLRPRSGLLIHADNSAGVEQFDRETPFNAVRVGLLQFGVAASPVSLLADLETEPVLSFQARISLIKALPAGTGISYGAEYRTGQPATVAIVAAGYGDGVPIGLGNRGEVLIRGRRCPIRGRVTMDQTVVEVTGLECAVGDTATFIGEALGQRITATEVSERAGSIPYEVFCSLTARVPRYYRTVLGV